MYGMYNQEVNHRKIFWLTLALLLFLRIPLASWAEYLWPAATAGLDRSMKSSRIF